MLHTLPVGVTAHVDVGLPAPSKQVGEETGVPELPEFPLDPLLLEEPHAASNRRPASAEIFIFMFRYVGA